MIKIDSLTEENFYPGDRISTRFGGLSRGRCWGRLGTGDNVTWAPKDGSYVTLPSPGKWTVGSSDGFSRKESSTYTVVVEPATVTDEQIAEIRAATTSADVIEACDSALEGDAKSRRSLSRRYAEVSAAEKKRVAAERKAERAARAAAEASARAGVASDVESIALDAAIEGRTAAADAIRDQASK